MVVNRNGLKPDNVTSESDLVPLRLLSFNIQVGIRTRHFGDYIMASWQHLLPNQKRLENLHNISHLLKAYDIVALQEADGGSIRSNFINQVELLANYSGFPHWYHQCNRNLGKIAQHSNGILTKFPVSQIVDHKLPGFLPGRGAIEAIMGDLNNKQQQLKIIVAHLALSYRARSQQISYIADHIRDFPYVIIMGDLNCPHGELHAQFSEHGVDLKTAEQNAEATFPSWHPTHRFDHILVSPCIEIESQAVLPNPISDHLPVALDVLIPSSILKINTPLNHYHSTRINEDTVHQQTSGRKL